MMSRRHSTFLSMVFITTACSSPMMQVPIDDNETPSADGGTSDMASPSNDSGVVDHIDGRLLFRGLGEGVAFNIVMNRVSVPPPVSITRGDGHCDVHKVGEGDSFVEIFPPGDLDLGATVTATDGTTTLTAKVDRNGGGFQYLYSQAGVDAFGKKWTLTNSGSAAGLEATKLVTVSVPNSVVPIVPAPGGGSIDTSSGRVTLSWSGGEGGQTFHIYLQTPSAEIDCYPPKTATSFELPEAIVKQLPRFVTPAIWSESFSVARVGIRRLWVRVTSDNLD